MGEPFWSSVITCAHQCDWHNEFSAVIYVFTHDSIAMGEDGPTHQPVEQLLGLRSIPGMVVIRPADANETVAAWRIAIARKGPVALVLTRQGLPVLDLNHYSGYPRECHSAVMF